MVHHQICQMVERQFNRVNWTVLWSSVNLNMSIEICNQLVLLAIIFGASVISGNDIENLEYWVDPQISPCDNFYRFACGGMIEAPPDDFEGNLFSVTEAEVRAVLIESLKKDMYDEVDNISHIRAAKNLFSACTSLNTTQFQNFGFAPNEVVTDFIFTYLEDMGGWPVLKSDTWDEEAFNWERIILKSNNQSYWINNFFVFESTGEVEEPVEFHEMLLGRDKITLSKGLEDANVSMYLEEGVQLAVKFGADEIYAREEFAKVVTFEIELATILSTNSLNGSEIKRVTLGKLMDDYPFYPWDEYIQFAFPPHIKINLDQELAFENYYDIIKDIYELISRTGKRVQANYIAWRQISSMLNYCTDFTVSSSDETLLQLECFNIVNRLLPYSLGTLYSRTILNQEEWKQKIKEAETIARSIRKQYIEMLNNSTWLSKGTRYNALKKIETITFSYGYSDELYNGTLLDAHYETLSTNESNFMESVINIAEFKGKIGIDAYKKSTTSDKDEKWKKSAVNTFVPNAYYHSESNSIEIPLGMIADRFLNINHSRYLNYGRFGSIIGHEFGHSFDPNFRYLSRNAENISWWSEYNSAQYNYKVQCLENQYKSIVDVGNNLREKNSLTLDEDVADNLGFKAAYFAHKNSPIDEADYETILHGKTYNRDQMFWISAASTWCQKVEPLREAFIE